MEERVEYYRINKILGYKERLYFYKTPNRYTTKTNIYTKEVHAREAKL